MKLKHFGGYMSEENLKIIFQEMADRWQSNVVTRTEVGIFSGGILSDRYLANLDSAGLGPEGRFRVGRKIAYPVNSLVRFLESRATTVNRKFKA